MVKGNNTDSIPVIILLTNTSDIHIIRVLRTIVPQFHHDI